MARSSSLSGFVMIFGLIVFLIGLVVFCLGLVRGSGIQITSLVAMGVGLAGIVIGRRVGRKAQMRAGES